MWGVQLCGKRAHVLSVCEDTMQENVYKYFYFLTNNRRILNKIYNYIKKET